MSKINKARFWWAVLYPENMNPAWEIGIDDILQVPFAYCIHNASKDIKSEHRKDHVHIILAFSNTTTYKHAFEVFSLLNAEGKSALNKCEAIVGIRNAYDYLIHDTDSCRKAGKEFYDPKFRIIGNNFDIGSYEQVSLQEKQQMRNELTVFCIDNVFINYTDLCTEILKSFDDKYFDVLCSYSSHFERVCKGNFLNEVYKKKF